MFHPGVSELEYKAWQGYYSLNGKHTGGGIFSLFLFLCCISRVQSRSKLQRKRKMHRTKYTKKTLKKTTPTLFQEKYLKVEKKEKKKKRKKTTVAQTSFSKENNKEIIKIILLYNDGSFEGFNQ